MTELIKACEADLRAGRISQAAAQLRNLKPSEIPREFRLPLANLCRRAQMDYLALRILSPVVRPEKITTAPTAEEQSEYAASLLKIGAVHEAIAILDGIHGLPSAKLFKAFCHIKRWEYQKSIPLLEDYIAQAPSDYQKLVGKVNLAASFAATLQIEKAHTLLTELIQLTHNEDHLRLWANSHEIRAQLYIYQGLYDQAQRDLELASSALKDSGDGLLVQKWSAILVALQSGDTKVLAEFREQAEKNRDWESLRDVDFFQLTINHDDHLLSRLVYGTPFEFYRSRVTSHLGRQPSSQNYIFGSENSPRFILATGEVEGMSISAPGNTVHQLLAVLLSDLYRPWSVGSIFAELFPGEYFDVFSSPNRVHQLLWRLRRWFESNQIPVVLTEYDGQYRLELNGDFSFVIPSHRVTLDEQEIYLRKIQSLFGQQSTFSSREVQEKLGISSSSFKRLASWALENKKIERMGASRATVYKIVA